MQGGKVNLKKIKEVYKILLLEKIEENKRLKQKEQSTGE